MSKSELTKLQREVLEAAARRNDYAAWPIRGGKLNTGSATRVIKELIRKELVVEKPAIAKAPVWREDDDGRPLMAVIADAGLDAVGMAPIGKKARSSRTAGKKAPVAAKGAVVAAISPNEKRRPRPGTKLAVLVELLERKEGATVAELSEAVGWKTHSTRGVLSGTLQKQLGLRIVSEHVQQRGRVYRLV